MAFRRIRVCVGYKDDGTSIIRQISGYNELELADNIVKAIIQSERRTEFVPSSGDGIMPLKDVPTFREYTDAWLKTYKEGKLKPTSLKGYWDSETSRQRLTDTSIQGMSGSRKPH